MNPLTEGTKITLGYDYFAKGFTGPQLSEAYYRLSANKEQSRLLFETATIDQVDEVYNPGDPCDENDRMMTEEMVMEAIRIQHFARTDTKMAALVRVFNGFLKDKNIEAQAPIIGRPKKSGLFATVTVQIPFSDGQVASIVFHSPDNNKMKITADDEIIAFRWLLNKRDITHVVSPEADAEVSLQEIGKRTAQLVEKNSARFQVVQKDLVAQKKTLEEVKTQAEEAVKQHDELMGKLKDDQAASETADAKIANLRDRIGKQKSFNEGLQGKIDSLKAEKAGNDGKAAGGDTPKDEAAMKAEQDTVAFEEKKAAFEQELTGRGFKGSPSFTGTGIRMSRSYDGVSDGVYWVSELLPSGEKYKVRAFADDEAVDDPYDPKPATLTGLDTQVKKALAWIDKKLAGMKAIGGDDAARDQFVATATSDDVVTMSEDDYNAALKRFKVDINGKPMGGVGKVETRYAWAIRFRLEDAGITNPQALAQKFLELYDVADGTAKSPLCIGMAYALEKVDGYKESAELLSIKENVVNNYDSVAQKIKDIATGTGKTETTDYQKERADRDKQIAESNRLVEVGKVAVPGVRLQDAEDAGKLWEMKGRGELTQEDWDKYVADLNASNKVAAPEPVPASEPAEPAAVGVLNDILAGKYDGDSTKLGEALDQAASELERDGKAEQYDALLNQVADYLTEILKKEAA